METCKNGCCRNLWGDCEQEKKIKFEDLPIKVRNASAIPFLLSDDISPRVSRIIGAVIEGDEKATHEALKDLQNHVKLKIQNAEDKAKLSAVPLDALKEFKGSIRQVENYLRQLDILIQGAIESYLPDCEVDGCRSKVRDGKGTRCLFHRRP